MLERFWDKVNKAGPTGVHRPDLGPCWIWQAGRNSAGYGLIKDGANMRCAHRVIYESTVGPIPSGFVVDHLCRNSACVNPGHLEPKTYRGNAVAPGSLAGVKARQTNLAKTHCPSGHLYAGSNLYVDPTRGKRYCCECRRLCKQRKRDRERRAAA